MSDPILVAVAWPYANADIHVGNLTGSHLPADIFARYQRMRGRQVLMVSGSDSHGTPITVRADAEETTPLAVYKRFHEGFIELFQNLGIEYDLFTSTHTQNHIDVAQKMFLALKKNGFLYKESQKQWFSPKQEKFLPDRYVEGTCYICGYTNARSDQCDKCGSLLEPELLKEPRSKIDGSTPELRETEHYFLDLGRLQDRVVEFLHLREGYWRSNVMRQSLGQISCTAAPSLEIWIGVFPCLVIYLPKVRNGTAKACMSGSRLLSGTSRPPLSGRKPAGMLKPGAIGGKKKAQRPTISSAKTTFPSTRSSGRRNCSEWALLSTSPWAAKIPNPSCSPLTYPPTSS
jgi:hypothetical protein